MAAAARRLHYAACCPQCSLLPAIARSLLRTHAGIETVHSPLVACYLLAHLPGNRACAEEIVLQAQHSTSLPCGDCNALCCLPWCLQGGRGGSAAYGRSALRVCAAGRCACPSTLIHAVHAVAAHSRSQQGTADTRCHGSRAVRLHGLRPRLPAEVVGGLVRVQDSWPRALQGAGVLASYEGMCTLKQGGWDGAYCRGPGAGQVFLVAETSSGVPVTVRYCYGAILP